MSRRGELKGIETKIDLGSYQWIKGGVHGQFTSGWCLISARHILEGVPFQTYSTQDPTIIALGLN